MNLNEGTEERFVANGTLTKASRVIFLIVKNEIKYQYKKGKKY